MERSSALCCLPSTASCMHCSVSYLHILQNWLCKQVGCLMRADRLCPLRSPSDSPNNSLCVPAALLSSFAPRAPQPVLVTQKTIIRGPSKQWVKQTFRLSPGGRRELFNSGPSQKQAPLGSACFLPAKLPFPPAWVPYSLFIWAFNSQSITHSRAFTAGLAAPLKGQTTLV